MKQHQTNSFISRAAAMLLTVIMAFAGAQTARAQGGLYMPGEVMVNINGSGTVTLTHSGGTDVVVKSGTIYDVSGDYTLKFLPSGGNVINKVTYKTSMMVNAKDITNLTPIDGGKSYSSNINHGIDEYNVYFGEPDAASRYALAWNGNIMTFSVGGETVTAAEEGQRVDITLSDPDANTYWVVSSNDVSPITQDDANHFHFTMPATDVRVTAYLTHIRSYTFTDNSTHGHVNCSGGNGWGQFHDGETATLTVEADAYYMYTDGTLSAKKQNGEAIDLTDQGDGTWTLIMPESDVYVTATFIPDPDHFEDNGDGTYTIKSAAGWGVFCDALQDLDTYNRFIGKTVKLADDITVSSMAGSDSHDFCGTFDGQEHTLTFNYSTGTDDAAPFRYVEDGCVIENLRVCGTIQTSAKYAAGLIAHQYGNVTIRNCRSSVTIKSSFSSGNGDGTHGGFVAQNHNAGDITFEGCLFDGKLLKTGSTATTRCGGFVGWRSNNEGAVIKVKNSLYAPAALEVGEYWISTTESATFVRNGIASDITNSSTSTARRRPSSRRCITRYARR